MNHIIESGATIGKNCFIGNYVVIRKGCSIGDNVVIGHNTTLEEDVFVGNGARIQANCYLTKGMFIEDNVFIGPSFSSCNDMYICSHGRPHKSELIAPTLLRDCRIGGGVTIGPEVVIGANAMIGCGSLVLRDVPDGQLWFGHPAKFVKFVPKDELI